MLGGYIVQILWVDLSNERIRKVYNIFLLLKMDKFSASVHRQWILTFRLKYVFVVDKIIRTARQNILKSLEGYSYKKVFG